MTVYMRHRLLQRHAISSTSNMVSRRLLFEVSPGQIFRLVARAFDWREKLISEKQCSAYWLL